MSEWVRESERTRKKGAVRRSPPAFVGPTRPVDSPTSTPAQPVRPAVSPCERARDRPPTPLPPLPPPPPPPTLTPCATARDRVFISQWNALCARRVPTTTRSLIAYSNGPDTARVWRRRRNQFRSVLVHITRVRFCFNSLQNNIISLVIYAWTIVRSVVLLLSLFSFFFFL